MASFLAKRLGPLAVITALGQAAIAAREHWGLLSPRERADLQRLLAKSRGRPANLSSRERDELLKLVKTLEPGQLARRVAESVSPVGLGGRRRR